MEGLLGRASGELRPKTAVARSFMRDEEFACLFNRIEDGIEIERKIFDALGRLAQGHLDHGA